MQRFSIAFVLLAAALPALAQPTQNPEEEGRAPAKARAVEAQTEAASRQSQAAGEAADVTYEQVMADPDNVDLDFRFATAQIKRGDLKGASATLERIVSIRPNMHRARLLYAIVLYRLDDLSESERELTTLKTTDGVPGDIKSEAQDYLLAIERRRRQTHFSAAVSLGGGYDINRNASPAGGKVLLGGNPLQLSGASERRDDFSYPFMANLGVSRDLKGGHKAWGSFGLYQSEQILMKTLNIKAYSGRGGATWRTPWGDATPTLLFDHVQLAQQTFLRDWGTDLGFTRKFSTQEEGYVRAAYTFQQYSPTAQVAIAQQRTGNQWEFGFGYGYWFRPTQRLVPSYTYLIKNAASSFDAYTRHQLALDHTWLLGKGMFVLNGLTFGFDRYVAQDLFVSPQIRSDDNYRLRTIFGAPLSLLFKPAKDFLGTITYEYYHSNSNLLNYSYTNNKLSAMLTYSWGI